MSVGDESHGNPLRTALLPNRPVRYVYRFSTRNWISPITRTNLFPLKFCECFSWIFPFASLWILNDVEFFSSSRALNTGSMELMLRLYKEISECGWIICAGLAAEIKKLPLKIPLKLFCRSFTNTKKNGFMDGSKGGEETKFFQDHQPPMIIHTKTIFSPLMGSKKRLQTVATWSSFKVKIFLVKPSKNQTSGAVNKNDKRT